MPVFAKDYKKTPGMNNPQRDADAKSWKVDLAMPTGESEFLNLGERSGPQVGNGFDATLLGQERGRITHP